MTEARIAHGAPWRRNRNCPFNPLSGNGGKAGTHRRMRTKATMPHKATMAKAARQVMMPLI